VKQLFVCGGLIVLGLLGRWLGERLSSDAIGMAVGLVFGMLACVPIMLLILASERRRSEDSGREEYQPYQPPVVVIAPTRSPEPYQPPPQQQITNNYYGPVQQNVYVPPPGSDEYLPPTVQLAQRRLAQRDPYYGYPHPDEARRAGRPQFRIVGMTEEQEADNDSQW
jgi:hypothetical protein